MRIGTFNLAGRWSPQHHDFLVALDCDVWLLTEVSERTRLDGFDLHLGEGVMAPRRRWAAVAATGNISPLADPHPASAMIERDGIRFCSSIHIESTGSPASTTLPSRTMSSPERSGRSPRPPVGGSPTTTPTW